MEWLVDNLIALLALAASLFSLWQSHRATKLSVNLERSNTLSEIYDKMRPGRHAMRMIWDGWAKQDKNLLSPTHREQFISHYNAYFHNATPGSTEQDLSNDIHTLMHELDRLADRIATGEFTKEQVLQNFGHAIAMDAQLILLYLNAHWKDHGELEKTTRVRFWSGVPQVTASSVTWKTTMSKNS